MFTEDSKKNLIIQTAYNYYTILPIMSSNLKNPEDNHNEGTSSQQVGLDGPRLKDGTPMNRGSFSIPRSHKIPVTKENQHQGKRIVPSNLSLHHTRYAINGRKIYLSAKKKC